MNNNNIVIRSSVFLFSLTVSAYCHAYQSEFGLSRNTGQDSFGHSMHKSISANIYFEPVQDNNDVPWSRLAQHQRRSFVGISVSEFSYSSEQLLDRANNFYAINYINRAMDSPLVFGLGFGHLKSVYTSAYRGKVADMDIKSLGASIAYYYQGEAHAGVGMRRGLYQTDGFATDISNELQTYVYISHPVDLSGGDIVQFNGAFRYESYSNGQRAEVPSAGLDYFFGSRLRLGAGAWYRNADWLEHGLWALNVDAFYFLSRSIGIGVRFERVFRREQQEKYSEDVSANLLIRF